MSSDQIRQEEDKINSRTIVGVGVAALVIFAVGIFWAVQIQVESSGSIRTFTPADVPESCKDEIGMVYQTSFTNDFARKLQFEQMQQLKSVGWSDRANNKVHVPIDVAMKSYVDDAAKTDGKL